jgi:DNA end-binding protein Ku
MARKATARRRSEDAESDGAEARGAEGPGRSLWSGSISFGLLQIPVALYTAERKSEEIHFRLLDKNDLSPVRYQRVNATTGEPVEWSDIVKGYEIEPDEYVVVDPEDLKKANVKATQTIDIQDFVPADQIDPAFFQKPYFVVPQPRATKAYVLLRRALVAKEAIAIATFVLRTREHLCAIMPASDALMLEVLRFDHELRRPEDMPIPEDGAASGAIGERELRMAEQLVEGMLRDFEPARYKDRYHRDVMKIIDEKAKNGTTRQHHTRMKGAVANDVVDLLDLLKRSVAEKGKSANDDGGRRPGPAKAGGPKKAKRRSASKKGEAA